MKITTRQSTISFSDDTIFKVFKNTRNNKLSSVEHEIYCIEKFSCGNTNIHSPNIIKFDSKSYVMKRYDFPLGILTSINRNFVREMLFTISIVEVIRQLGRIGDILEETEIRHRDVNPGNLLFSKKEKAIKLIDFFWAETDGRKVREPTQLNIRYGTNDRKALETIRREIKKVAKQLK
jgi:tRNA A-37 threonylcarbamoyl transferase component Bud32